MATKLTSEVLPLATDTGALANRINSATRNHHSRINNLISLKIVFALRDPKIYRQGIQSFYHVFKTFEDEYLIEMEKDTEVGRILKQVWTPALARTHPLQQDLKFYYGDKASSFEGPILDKQIEFVQHIKKVVRDKPHLLLAYAHVMYLALFAGGRILRSNIMKATGLFPQVPGMSFEDVAAKGTNLFRFEVDDEEYLRADFKTRYELATRNALSEQQKRDIIDESINIFNMNTACVSEIARRSTPKLDIIVNYVAKVSMALVALVILFFLYVRVSRYL